MEGDIFMLSLPTKAKILSVQMQHNKPVLWALIDTEQIPETRIFKVAGTGHPIMEKIKQHIGTWQDGPFVWHLFELER